MEIQESEAVEGRKQFQTLVSLFDELVTEFVDKTKTLHPELEEHCSGIKEFIHVLHDITEIIYVMMMTVISNVFSSEKTRNQLRDRDPRLWIDLELFGFNFAAFWLLCSDTMRDCIWRYLELMTKVCDKVTTLPAFSTRYQSSVEMGRKFCDHMDSVNLVSVFHLVKSFASEDSKPKLDPMTLLGLYKSFDGLSLKKGK